MRNSFWHMTHPCWSINGYRCKCGIEHKTKGEHNAHVVLKHTKIEAETLLSWKDYEKYYE